MLTNESYTVNISQLYLMFRERKWDWRTGTEGNKGEPKNWIYPYIVIYFRLRCQNNIMEKGKSFLANGTSLTDYL